MRNQKSPYINTGIFELSKIIIIDNIYNVGIFLYENDQAIFLWYFIFFSVFYV